MTSYLDYCRKLLCSLMEVDNVTLFPVSARHGQGVEALRQVILGDCAAAVMQILEESTQRKLKNIITSALGQLELYWTALKMPISRFHNRFSRMETTFNQIQERGNKDAASLKKQGEELLQSLKQQQEDNRHLLDFSDDIHLREQLTALYSKQLTTLETLLHSTSDQLILRINELKQELSSSVTDLFGMEYHYPLNQLTVTGEEAPADCHSQRVAAFVDERLPQVIGQGSSAIFKAINDSYADLLSQQSDDLLQGFAQDIRLLCDQLNQTMNTILLYREEDTYTVAKRIDDLNKLIRHLKELRSDL